MTHSTEKRRAHNSTLPRATKPLERRTKLKATKALEGGGTLSRGRPMPKVNHARRYRLDKEQYGDKAVWIRTLPCYVTGRPPMEDDPIVAAHVRSRGAGGKSEDIVPLHPLVELDWHGSTEHAFEDKYGVSKQDVKDAAERYEAAWQKRSEAE